VIHLDSKRFFWAGAARSIGWLGMCLGGCARAAATPNSGTAANSSTLAAAAPSHAAHAPASASAHEAAAAPPAVTGGPAPPTAAPVSPVLELATDQVLTASVTSIALGEGTRIAVLADPPYLGDVRGLRPLPLPKALLPKSEQHDQAQIFFGRDNEPRIMGTRRSSAGEVAIYFRHTNAGWRDGREEIGQLGSATAGGLWGVLGSADPELVCRANSVCIIKRTSGWTSAPAGPNARLVELDRGTLWGLDASGISTIDAHGWSTVIAAPAWSEPRAFWATQGEAWVAAGDALFHYHARAWSKQPSPIAEVQAFWGTRPDSVWLVGGGGAAHYDGHDWRTLSIAGPLSAVRGRTDSDVWLGGARGLFHARL
jgi:hypothetical protein